MTKKTEEELEQQVTDLGVEITSEDDSPDRYHIEYVFNGKRMAAMGGTRRNALMSVVTFVQQWTQGE